MIKPINVFGIYFAEDIGNIIALVFQNMLPIFIIGSLMIKLPAMANPKDIPLFVISVIESFLINWLVAALFGMIAFILVQKHLLRLLSGSIIPIWFFPVGVQKVLEGLPFVYIYQLPLSIYIGKGSSVEYLSQMRIQFIWFVVLSVVFFLVQNKVTRKVMVQGG